MPIGERGRRGAGFARRRQAGFTLVGVVIFIAVLTILVAAIGPSVFAVQQRDKDREDRDEDDDAD